MPSPVLDRRGNWKLSTYLFRDCVIDYLREAGFDVRAPAERRGVTPYERVFGDFGDILGVPNFAIAVRNAQTHDLSGAIREVEHEARNAGVDLYASIQSRRGYDVADSYVSLPLRVFVRVLAKLEAKT